MAVKPINYNYYLATTLKWINWVTLDEITCFSIDYFLFMANNTLSLTTKYRLQTHIQYDKPQTEVIQLQTKP